MNRQTLIAVNLGIENLTKPYHIKCVGVALESFDEHMDQRAISFALEGIKDTLKNVWDKISGFISKLTQSILVALGNQKAKAKKYNAAAKAIIDKVKSGNTKPSGSKINLHNNAIRNLSVNGSSDRYEDSIKSLTAKITKYTNKESPHVKAIEYTADVLAKVDFFTVESAKKSIDTLTKELWEANKLATELKREYGLKEVKGEVYADASIDVLESDPFIGERIIRFELVSTPIMLYESKVVKKLIYVEGYIKNANNWRHSNQSEPVDSLDAKKILSLATLVVKLTDAIYTAKFDSVEYKTAISKYNKSFSRLSLCR